MAIKGFLRPSRYARLGKIRLGKRVANKSGNGDHPDDLPFFRVPQEVAAALHPVTMPDGSQQWLPYGDEPDYLDVMLPTSDWEQFCRINLERWAQDETLLCIGDGETARCLNDQLGAYVEQDCPYKDCPFFGKAKGQGCDETAHISVILPYVNMLGIYEIATKSHHGMHHLQDEFCTARDAVINISGNPDLIRAVQFRLTRELKTIHYHEDGKRHGRDKYLLHLRAQCLPIGQARQLAATFGTDQGGGPMLSSGETMTLPQMQAANSGQPALPPAMDMPEDAEPECHRDLVAGASPEGADMGQRDAWAALMEQAAGLGLDTNNGEVKLCRQINPEAVRFDDLTHEEADLALQRMSAAVLKHQADQEQAAAESSGATAADVSGAREAAATPPQQAPPQQQPRQQTFPATSQFTASGQAVPVGPGGGNGSKAARPRF